MAVSIIQKASATGSTTTLTVTKPTGTVDGHKMIAFMCGDSGTYAGMAAPAGWTLLTGLDQGTNNIHVKIFTKTASSEGANYAFTQDIGSDGCCSIVTLAGANNTTTSWLYATPTWAANSTSRVAPTVTNALSDSVLLCYAMVDMNNTAATWTPPTGMTEQVDVQSNTWATQSVASLLNPPNPTGTQTFTVSSSTFFGTVGGIQWSVVIPAPVNAGQFFPMF